MAIIAKYLNFNPPEIKVLLQTFTDDKDLHELMGTDDTVLTEDERPVIDFYRDVAAKGKEAKEDLVSQFKIVGKLHELDTKDLINKRGGKGLCVTERSVELYGTLESVTKSVPK